VKWKGNERFRIRLPASLREVWERIENKKIPQILKEGRFLEKDVKFISGRLSFKPEVIEQIFEQSVTEVVDYIKQSLSDPRLRGIPIDAIIVVGGFAMSGYVLEGIRQAFKPKGIPVIRPQGTELAVLKGAVLFGQNESIITSRVMPFTYGVAFTMEFDPTKHKEECMYEDKGQKWANFVFRKHVTHGQSIRLGEWIVDKEYYPVDDNQDKATVYLFASKEKDPIHTIEKGCFCIGSFEIVFPKSGPSGKKLRRAVKVAMRFGGTEVEVRGVVESTGKTFKKNLRLP